MEYVRAAPPFPPRDLGSYVPPLPRRAAFAIQKNRPAFGRAVIQIS
jgi:hypothetical protein